MAKQVTYFEHIMNTPIPKGQIPFYIGIHTLKKTIINYHSFAEFSYVLEGYGQFDINGMTYPIMPGSMNFVPPNQVHAMESTSEQSIMKFCCLFDMAMLSGPSYDADWPGWLYHFGNQALPHAVLSGEYALNAEQLFRSILQEFEQPNRVGRNVMIQSKLAEAITLFRRVLADQQQPDEKALPAANSLFWPILRHINTHYGEPITLEAIAKQFHLSESYVGRLFREHTDKSFLEFLHQLRINNASNLLISTDMPITDIAFEVGFESFRTFSRVFRDLIGVSPSDYRKQGQ